MRPLKIYVVTDGSYSDFHLCGIYSTYELAKEAHEQYYADNDIEEWNLDEIPEHPPGRYHFTVQMDVEGNVARVKRENAEYFPYERQWAPYGRALSCCEKYVIFHIWATDEKHAVKIANERRLFLLAKGEWTVSWDEWKARTTTTVWEVDE